MISIIEHMNIERQEGINDTNGVIVRLSID